MTLYLLTLPVVEELQFTHTLEQNEAPESDQRQRKLHYLLHTQVNPRLNNYTSTVRILLSIVQTLQNIFIDIDKYDKIKYKI